MKAPVLPGESAASAACQSSAEGYGTAHATQNDCRAMPPERLGSTNGTKDI